jgi:hypothetical protein
MKAVKPININLSIMDTLLIIDGMDYIANDTERHEIDRAGAKRLKDKILNEVEAQAIEIERGD